MKAPDRAGINRKTFYLHYETIEAFYDEIMNGIMDEFFEYHEKHRRPWDMGLSRPARFPLPSRSALP